MALTAQQEDGGKLDGGSAAQRLRTIPSTLSKLVGLGSTELHGMNEWWEGFRIGMGIEVSVRC